MDEGDGIDEMDRLESINHPEDLYDFFVQTKRMDTIVASFDRLKAAIGVEKDDYDVIFPALKKSLTSWKCASLWKLLDQRAGQKEYKSSDCSEMSILIIGGGPIGLRAAIECRMLGCKVVIVEKRTRITRNNVLHLWPFTIEDLKQLGAKKFYGKFCAGAIDHISIRSLQTILLKISLILGVEIHMGVSYEDIQEPQDSSEGWGITMEPSDHPVTKRTFDAVIGCEGTRYCLKGFDRKEFRGKLALAITANFINRNTEQEAAVEEISGVAFIFNQKFFKDLKAEMDIELENIVYYKDDTHYFVMTAKKDSLIRKGVILQDYPTSQELLMRDNINLNKLQQYAVDAAQFSTDLPNLEFAPGNRGQPDVALFDFTSLFQAEHSSRIICRYGKTLLLMLAGDSLLEPFWPTGTGLARGFLGALDAAWMIREMAAKKPSLQLLSERESIYQLLSQTTPDKMCRNIKTYTIDPASRYHRLNLRTISPHQVSRLFDDSKTRRLSLKRSIDLSTEQQPAVVEPLKKPKPDSISEVLTENGQAVDDDDIITDDDVMVNATLSHGTITRALYGDEEGLIKDSGDLLSWLQHAVDSYNIKVTNFSDSWSNGLALAALIHRYHPELIDFKSLKKNDSVKNNKLCFSVAEKNLGISSLLNPREMKHPDKLALITYLSYFYDLFHDKDPADSYGNKPPKSPPAASLLATSPPTRSWNTKLTLQRPVNEPAMVMKRQVTPRAMSPRPPSLFGGANINASDKCYFCQKKVYLMERQSAEGVFFHRSCFRCHHCQMQLKIGNYSYSRGTGEEKGRFYCTPHFRQLFLSNPEAINYGRQREGQPTPAAAAATKTNTAAQKTVTPPPPAVTKQEDKLKQKEDQQKEEQKWQDLDKKPLEAKKFNNAGKGRGKVVDRIKNWESGHVVPVDTTPPRVHDDTRIQQTPPRDDKPQGGTTRRSIVSKAHPVEQDSSSDDDVVIGNVMITRVPLNDVKVCHHGSSDEYSEDDEVMPLASAPSTTRRVVHSTPRQDDKSIQSDEEEETGHRRSSQVITKPHPSLKRKHQSDFSLLSNSEPRARPQLQKRQSFGVPSRLGRGQKSIFRKMVSQEDEIQLTDIKLQEHRKHRSRLLRAQEVQREMSQLEQQYDELEQVGCQIEQKLRGAGPDDDVTSSQLMRQFLGLVNERNALIRKINELSLSIKELSLEDKQYEIDARLEEYCDIQEVDMTEQQKKLYEQLLTEKLEVVDERDQLVQQLEADRLREQEEDEMQCTMIETKFGGEEPFDARKTPSPPAPPMNTSRNVQQKKKKSKSNLK